MGAACRLLAIETSCDETAIAALTDETGSLTLRGQRLASQIKKHRAYGGVVPEVAARAHVEVIHNLLDGVLADAGWQLEDLTAVAVTQGPGLEGALLVGNAVAKTLCALQGIPLIGVHHIWGHIYSTFLAEPNLDFPFVALVVSGGHTQLIKVDGHFQMMVLGETRDDAVGEAYDKVARCLKLPYPGGPEIEKQALSGDSSRFVFSIPMKPSPYEFSFSGLKTAVAQQVAALEAQRLPIPIADLAAGFQNTVIATLTQKAIGACLATQTPTLVVCGGVSANMAIRDALQRACFQENIRLIVPPMAYCTDNAAMIGVAGYYQLNTVGPSPLTIRVKPHFPLESVS
mgnify:CR=1 FL=1